jgi:signal transduction histidine kinase
VIGRGAFAIFLGVCALAVAQVAWWITFLVRTGAERRHVVMFASEGSFFMVLLLLGVWLMYRTLAEQVRLREMRATFLSSVTHELKSPLAAIRLFLETLEQGRADEEKRRDLVRKMLLDTERLERLVNDLLRAGRIEAGALSADEGEARLDAVVEGAAERARLRCGPGDEVRVEGPGPVLVPGDEELLRSAVENLLDNAVKYSPAPRRVVARLRADALEAVVEVEDAGLGIDPAFAARAFQPFARSGREETRAAPGTGLGLFLVRGIAEAHGGRAWIRPRPEGRGTVAGIALPRGKGRSAPLAAARAAAGSGAGSGAAR